jgi:hypothetical protein
MNPTDNSEDNRERNRWRSAPDQQIPARRPPAGASLQGAPTQRFGPGTPSSDPAGRGRVTDGGQSARTQHLGVGENAAPPVFGPGEHHGQYGTSATYGDQRPSAPGPSWTPAPHPSAPPPRAPRQSWAAPPPPPPPRQSAATPDMGDQEKLSIIERLMLRGARGELIRQPWFQSIRQGNADLFVRVAFGAAIVITLVLEFGLSSISMTGMAFEVVVWYPLWLALGYFYIAVGTKLAQRFLFGICVVGVLVSLTSVWGAFSALSYAHSVQQWLGVQVVPMGLIIFRLLFDLAMAAVFGYLGVLVYRGIKRLGS